MAERFLIRELPQTPVPDSMKKKAEKLEKLRIEKAAAVKEKRMAMRTIRHDLKMRTYGYEKEYRENEEKLINLRREAKLNNGFYKEDDQKVIFAIRLKGINKLAPKPKKILQLFRLRQIHNGVFIKINKATTEMLKSITPFVTFGYPSLKTIRDLIYKRGYAKIGKQGAWSRKRLLNNDMISENLGQYGIHGIEDIVHEIYTCGPHFKQVTNFLWPFKLSSPKGGWSAKRRGFADPRGGDWGNRETLINPLLNRMN